MKKRQCKRCGAEVSVVQGLAPEEGAMLLLNGRNGLDTEYLCPSCTDLVVPHLIGLHEVLGDEMLYYHHNSYTTLLRKRGILKG